MGAYITPEKASMFARNTDHIIRIARQNGYLLPKGKCRLINK